MIWSIDKANKVFELFKKRAKEDEQFRLLALNNPTEAVRQLTGMGLPDRIHLTVTEDKFGHLEVTTHVFAPSGEQELDESESIIVTGGVTYSAFLLHGPPYSEQKK